MNAPAPIAPTTAVERGERVAWFNCFAGIAGDMALGSLIDAGADLEAVRDILAGLPLDGWSLDAETVRRGGLSATRALVGVRDPSPARRYPELAAIIESARLPERVHRRSLAVLRALGEAESRVHGTSLELTVLHDLSGDDVIIDVTGTAAALEVLDVADVSSSSVGLGVGAVAGAHGILPNPPPAVVDLLSGARVHGHNIDAEMTTPTGAALLAALATGFGPAPDMYLVTSGFGAGSRDLDGMANCTQVIIGAREGGKILVDSEGKPRTAAGERSQALVVLETNLDDVTGEVLADVVASALECGAMDSWITPIVMKKGRPAHTLSVLCDPAVAAPLRRLMAAATGALGVRAYGVDRWALPRSLETVEVDGVPVRVKVGPYRSKAEHEDVLAASKTVGRTAQEVSDLAEAEALGRALGRSAKDPPGPYGAGAGQGAI